MLLFKIVKINYKHLFKKVVNKKQLFLLHTKTEQFSNWSTCLFLKCQVSSALGKALSLGMLQLQPLQVIPVAGKPEAEPTDDYVKGAVESVTRNLKKYQESGGHELKGRNITIDRQYTGTGRHFGAGSFFYQGCWSSFRIIIRVAAPD